MYLLFLPIGWNKPLNFPIDSGIPMQGLQA